MKGGVVCVVWIEDEEVVGSGGGITGGCFEGDAPLLFSKRGVTRRRDRFTRW